MKKVSRNSIAKGSGLVDVIGNVAGSVLNKAIDILPVELHLPGGYRYCGPGTRLRERLARGDPGINKLDEACKEHDIAYSKYSDNQHRKQADQQLADRAWARVKSSGASLGERAAAWAVTNAMNVKAKLGGNLKRGKKLCSCKRKKKTTTRGKGYYLKPYKGSGSKKKESGVKRKSRQSKKKKSSN